MEAVEQALKRQREAPSLVLRAMIAEKLGDSAARERDLAEALGEFGPPARLSEWELGWLLTAARMVGDSELEEKARGELKLRQRLPEGAEEGGVLPGLRHPR
jgi:hypothetical protein